MKVVCTGLKSCPQSGEYSAMVQANGSPRIPRDSWIHVISKTVTTE